jgi:hypothetical protein
MGQKTTWVIKDTTWVIEDGAATPRPSFLVHLVFAPSFAP